MIIFSWFCRKSLPADSPHSNGYESCPSSHRHLFLFIQNGFHTVFFLNGKETVSISVQSHLHVHRWCIAHKQLRLRKVSGPDISLRTWDQGHHRKCHFYFLRRIATVDWEGWYTYIYDKRDDFNFHITNFPFLRSNIPSSPAYGVLSLNFYDTPGLAHRMNVLFWGPGDFPVSNSNRDTSWNAWHRYSGSFMVDTGILFSNMKSLSRMLNDIRTLDQRWLPYW